jgi:hypothetical protein
MKNKVLDLLKKYTNHEHIRLLPSGDSAIFLSLFLSKKINRKAFMLVPDQGGWLTYENYSRMLNFEIIKIKTDAGIIDLKDLENHVEKGSAFIYQNPAGYFAEQPIKEIYNICKEAGCLIILDATGCLGDEEMCNGNYADLIVASFGKWKPVNLGYGGFISAKTIGFTKHNEIIAMFQTNFDYEKLCEKLKNVKQRLNFLYTICEKVKKDLKEFDLIHPDKKGINVIARFKTKTDLQKLINYCEKNKYEYTLCPRYIRVMENAVSIEVKRLE